MLGGTDHFGYIRNPQENICLDIYGGTLSAQVRVYDCHRLGGNQAFSYTKFGQIVSKEEICLGKRAKDNIVISIYCDRDDANQRWTYDNNVRINDIFCS